MSSPLSQKDENNLISIDEVIFRAKSQGVDFGKGNPRERLRYLTKIGLLPHAKRKSFNGKPPNGAYPEYVIELLKEIDEKIKAGKSIQEIKKEKERKSLVDVPYTYIIPPSTLEIFQPKSEFPKIENESVIQPKFFKKIVSIFIIIFLVLILGGIIFFSRGQEPVRKNLSSYLLASFGWAQKLVQAPSVSVEENPATKEIFSPPAVEPYLTINAETAINAPLNVKEKITTPSLALQSKEFSGTLAIAPLTADRNYTFPNLSGTVCLTSGNCIGIGGEIFASKEGVENRLAKFISGREIGVASINDFYRGVALTIDGFGNVGIGTARPRGRLDVAGKLIADGKVGIGIEDPAYPLHVEGRIQATGDVCTNLGGGKCLSQITTGPIFWSGGGISGSGSTNYLPIWTAGTTLGNSIISQSGTTLSVAGMINVAGGGYFQGPLTLVTTTLPQLVLKYDDNNYFKISVASNGITFFDSSSGKIQAATNTVFYTANGNPIRKSGEEILRTAIPVFLYDIPSQTASSTYVKISKHFASTSEISLPGAMAGTTRAYRLAIKYADNIPTSSSSDWRIINQAGVNVYATTTLPGKNMTTLEEGVPYITELLNIPDNDWQVEVRVPSGTTIRIFNIFLLAFDIVN